MRKFNLTLSGILVIQIILVGVIYSSQDRASAKLAGPWIELNPDQLTELVITNGDGESVTLRQNGKGWQLPAKSGFPVKEQRLEGLLGDLTDARPGLPVAVSTEARKRFGVATDQFQRHLVLKNNEGVVADLYLGDRAGSGRVYARLADQDAIQDLAIALWRASASADDWTDKSYLELVLSDQKKVVLPDVTLTRSGNVWQIDDLSGKRLPDQGKIQAVLDRLRTLRWETLVGKTPDVTLPDQATFIMTVAPKDGTALEYRFYKQEAADDSDSNAPDWKVTRSDTDFVFLVNDDRVQPLLKASKTSLSKEKPTEEAGTTQEKGTAQEESSTGKSETGTDTGQDTQ